MSWVCGVHELAIVARDDHSAMVGLVELLMRQLLYPAVDMLALD
jgi:hypothetical protein